MSRPVVFALGILVGIVLMATLTQTVIGAPMPFCDRHPAHPRCQSPATSTPRITVAPTASPASTSGLARVSFGLGSQTESAIRSRLTAEAPIRILSNWHAKSADNAWMTDAYHRSVYADAKTRGFKLHLIDWVDLPETNGNGCGRQYPTTPQWVEDMRGVAEAMRPDYVTLMTEFQTFACTDNRWAGQETYWNALIANYERAVPIFRAVGSKVSIGWGGWQLQTDRSLDAPFTAVTEDFHSFQAMHGVSNVADIRGMTAFLGPGTMLAHHMPDGDTNDDATRNATFKADWQTLATDSSIANLVADGLFAWSIVNDVGWSDIPETYALVRDAIRRYGR